MKPLHTFFLVLIGLNGLAQDASRFYQTIDTLCSKTFYGRGYQQNGHLKTAAYLKTKLLNPQDQKFPLKINNFQHETLRLGADTLRTCADFIPLPQARSGHGTFKTLLLDSAFFGSKKKIKRFLTTNLADRAIVYPAQHESAITDHPLLRNKIYSESGVILKITDTELLTSFSQSAWMPPAFVVRSGAFNRQKVVSFELSQKEETITSSNIISTIQGTNPSLKELIVCAHYDHVGGYQECYIPGANDNASGVAMLLELYAYFLVHPPERTLRFIAFGGEEVGLVGSKFYVEHTDLTHTEFVLNLDLYGAGSGGVTVVNGSVFDAEFQLLERINAQKRYLTQIKKRGEAANSDHYYFSKNGTKAFFIYTNGTVGGYHNAKDTPEELEKGHFISTFGLLKDFLQEL